jgi:hypothetical protein
VRLALAFALLAICAFPGLSLARTDQPVLVLLLRRVPADEILAEAILRIKSELVAGGFEVAVSDIDSSEQGADPRALMERAGQDLAPSATIGIFGNLEQGSAELWVVDRNTGKTVIRRLEVQASSDRPISEVLAIRAQELLRASLVEFLLEGNRPEPASPTPSPQIHRWVKQAVESPVAPWTLGLELGATAFGGWGGIDPTVAPAARLRMALSERLWVRLTALGLGTRPRVERVTEWDTKSTSVSQNLLLVEMASWLRPRRLMRPLFSLGLGVERVSVEGSATLPYQGERNARWFAAGDAGVGVSLRLQAHWELQLEVHALFTTPRPTIFFLRTEVASGGQPTLLAILTLAGGA